MVGWLQALNFIIFHDIAPYDMLTWVALYQQTWNLTKKWTEKDSYSWSQLVWDWELVVVCSAQLPRKLILLSYLTRSKNASRHPIKKLIYNGRGIIIQNLRPRPCFNAATIDSENPCICSENHCKYSNDPLCQYNQQFKWHFHKR